MLPAMRLALLLSLVASASLTCGRTAGGAEPGALRVGEHADGTLSADSQDYEGVTTEAVPVRFEGGEPVAVVVTSEAMDPFAILAVRGAPVGASSGEAGGPGACVVLAAPHPLDVLVYVSSAGASPTGDFRVSVEPATPEVLAAHDCQAGAPAAPSPGLPEPNERTITA